MLLVRATGSASGILLAARLIQVADNASEDDYDLLHSKMRARRYFRLVKGGDDVWYHLPSATYTADKEKNAEAVRDEVAAIAESVWSDSGTFVTKADGGRYWKGLRKATSEQIEELMQ